MSTAFFGLPQTGARANYFGRCEGVGRRGVNYEGLKKGTIREPRGGAEREGEIEGLV